MSTQLPSFKIGDIVKWSSHSQGSWKEKYGQVVRIVSAGDTPLPELFPELKNCGLPRNHDSYIVMVGKRFYWPRVSKLEVKA